MIRIENDNQIYLTRGDSLKLLITIYNIDGTVYEPQQSDVIRFALKRSWCDEEVLINKTLNNAEQVLRLEPSETKMLQVYDSPYVWDVELTSGNDVDTFMSGTLTITEEVM